MRRIHLIIVALVGAVIMAAIMAWGVKATPSPRVVEAAPPPTRKVERLEPVPVPKFTRAPTLAQGPVEARPGQRRPVPKPVGYVPGEGISPDKDLNPYPETPTQSAEKQQLFNRAGYSYAIEQMHIEGEQKTALLALVEDIYGKQLQYARTVQETKSRAGEKDKLLDLRREESRRWREILGSQAGEFFTQVWKGKGIAIKQYYAEHPRQPPPQ